MTLYSVREAIPDSAGKALEAHPDLLKKLLYYRGIDTAEKAEAFLNPSYDNHVHDPFLLKGMDKAVERIIRAVKDNERILIYSDYDADGIPAAVLMSDFFTKIGFANYEVYIPHRHTEGFGLHLEAIDTFKDRVNLLITFDCGITDVAEVEHANSHGIDVIISDHHLPGEKLPPAYAIVDPKQPGCEYPYKMLCGAGVGYKIVQGILAKDRFGVKDGAEKWLLDMAGLATLSDMVPLDGENRVFAHYGLKVLRKSPRPGLQKLLRILKIDQRTLNEDDLGFMVTPRLNAASRMGIPMDAFTLLSSRDPATAGAMAEHLDSINAERKGMVAVLVKEVKKLVHEREDRLAKVIVLGNPNWRPALLGLAANTLVEEFARPVFLWGRESGDGIKGSCRSDGSVDLVQLMQRIPHMFTEFGGHSASGGFAVHPDKVHLLEEEILKAFEEVKREKAHDGPLMADALLSFDDVNPETYGFVEKLAPFGVGNAKPLFMFKDVVPADVRMFGKAKDHLELSFATSTGEKVRAIGFFMSAEDFDVPVKRGAPMTLLANLEKSYFGGRAELRLRIVDIV